MALATKCPQCGALFRVVADQLKLRGGLVRCGECRAVFDAIGSLTYVDDVTLAPARPPASETPATGAAPPPGDDGLSARHATGPSTTLRIAPVAPATLAGNLPPRIEPLAASTASAAAPVGPIEPAVIRRRPSTSRAGRDAEGGSADEPLETLDTDRALPAPTVFDDESHDASAAGHPAAEQFPAVAVTPTADADADADAAEDLATVDQPPPSFARPKRMRWRGFSIVYGGGTAVLVLLAALQFAVVLRGQLMMHWPQSRPMLVELCGVFGCTVQWPTQADRLAVLGTELQSIPGTDVLELNAVIRNRAEFRQSLPAVEVTLTDARNRPVARKVFTPADYLASAGEPTARLQEGLPPGSDFTIRIFFEARGLAPAGFLVYPFYL